MTEQPRTIDVHSLTPEGFAPFGWVLGKPLGGNDTAFVNAMTDFRSEHVFDAGTGGHPEILWVSYRNSTATLDELEVHYLTQQAIVPLIGSVIHIVAQSDGNGNPDMASVAAFHVCAGTGVCMKTGVWHATRVQKGADTACLMLTRQSTTRDLIAHLNGTQQATESAMQAVPTVRIAALS